MTTTLDAIRDEQIAVLQALTPKALASVKFRTALDELDFRTWAQAESLAAFRRFTIEDNYTYDAPEIHGGDVVFRRPLVDVIVAYPRDYRYGGTNRRGMRDVMDQDREQIDYAIGVWGTGNMTDSSASLVDIAYEQLESVVLMIMTLQVNYYRSTTGEAYVATQNSSAQSWQYTVAAAASSFAITIPIAMADTSYVVPAPTHTAAFACDFKVSSKTTTSFTLTAGAILPIGTVIDLMTRDA